MPIHMYMYCNYIHIILRKDFDVMFGHEEANTSVFTLLATACRDLMHVSMQIKSSLPTVAAKRTMYCRLLWSKYT